MKKMRDARCIELINMIQSTRVNSIKSKADKYMIITLLKNNYTMNYQSDIHSVLGELYDVCGTFVQLI